MRDPVVELSMDRHPATTTLTELLGRWSEGDRQAAEKLLDRTYGRLHGMARQCFRGEREGHTLQPTALLHEVVIDLLEHHEVGWQNRAHFFGLTACMMRRALVDHARERAAQKRGGHIDQVPFDGDRPGPVRSEDLVALDDALRDLEEVDRRKALIVELRYFGGMTVEETAECLGLSPRTVAREWRRARVFLYRQLAPEVRDAF